MITVGSDRGTEPTVIAYRELRARTPAGPPCCRRPAAAARRPPRSG
jgi:hypothetical protein